MPDFSKRKHRMLRKQVFITAEQNRRLKSLAAATGQSEGELIREGVEKVLEARASEEDWKAAIRRLAGMWKNRDDLDELFPRLRRSWDRSPEAAAVRDRGRKGR